MDAKMLLDRVLRLAGAALLLLTSAYCLIAYVPFTYDNMIRFSLIPWVTKFAAIQSWLYAVAVGALVFTMRDALSRPGVRWPARIFAGAQVALAIFIVARPVLPALENDGASFAWSVVFLVQLIGIGIVDVAACRSRLRFAPPTDGRDWTVFLAALATALFVSLLYFAIALLRVLDGAPFAAGEQLLVLAWSLLSHLVLFLGVAATFVLLLAFARLTRVPARAELVLCALLLWAVVFFAARDVVLSGVSLNGPIAALYAALFAVAIVANLAAVAVAGRVRRDQAIDDGLEALLGPLTLRPAASLPLQTFVLLALAGSAWMVTREVASFDWNYLVQKLCAGVVWCLSFALLYCAAKRHDPRPGWSVGVLAAAVVVLLAFRALQAAPSRIPALLGEKTADASPALARHAGYDASFRLLYDALAPRIADASAGSFYEFLQRNTNISRATKIDPVDVELVDDLQPTGGHKPNVFLFVVDSMRRDYLGAYNPKVDFTPAMDAFARESIVLESAFTRYGATGLSEPSIWVGGKMLHKQYVEPFYPMNALQKLLETDRYRSYVSVDTILTTILKPSDSITELDATVLNKDYDFCHSLQDLATKLHERKDRAQPVFAYTQPQNLHVAQITRQGSESVGDRSYPGFHAPYASRLERIDRCFGEFVATLKKDGLWDDSIVILTADHGESLGEEGRWGHAYTMYPEIVRIPLIVHLPPAMQAKLDYDPKAVSFLTDITPSLYYLLGHRPLRQDPIFGRPLFVAKEDHVTPRTPARDDEVMASSYGPVYAVLSDGGRSLWVSDGVNYKDMQFDLSPDGTSAQRSVTAAAKRASEQQIRDQVGEVNRFYRFGGADDATAKPGAAPAS
jgi:hypothetical protein